METEILQALLDLGLDPQAAAAVVEELKDLIEQLEEQAAEQVKERVLDFFSDKLGIRTSELDPVIIQLAGHLSTGAPRMSVSEIKKVDADEN